MTGQKKPFYRKRTPESSCARKETVIIDIHLTSRNGDRKNHAIDQNSEYSPLKNKEVEPVELVHMNTYQHNTFRKDYFDDKVRSSK